MNCKRSCKNNSINGIKTKAHLAALRHREKNIYMCVHMKKQNYIRNDYFRCCVFLFFLSQNYIAKCSAAATVVVVLFFGLHLRNIVKYIWYFSLLWIRSYDGIIYRFIFPPSRYTSSRIVRALWPHKIRKRQKKEKKKEKKEL